MHDQSCLHFLRRQILWSQQTSAKDSLQLCNLCSPLRCGLLGCRQHGWEKKKPNKLVRKASSVLCCILVSVEVYERRTLVKLTSTMNNASHPLHQSKENLCRSCSTRLIHPQCRKEWCPRSFIYLKTVEPFG